MRNSSPEVKKVPDWAKTGFQDGFLEMDAMHAGPRFRTSARAAEVVERLRRRQFNAHRDRLIDERRLHLATVSRQALRELGTIAPETAEYVLRSTTELVLGGRIVVPTEKRKINKKK